MFTCLKVFFTGQNIMQKEKPKGRNFEGLESKNELYERIELKVQMKKMGSFVYLSCLLPDL